MEDYKNNLVIKKPNRILNNIKAEAIKLISTQIAKTLFVTIIFLTCAMIAGISLFRFNTHESWIDSLNGVSSPAITLLALPFILLICEEWTNGTALITYTFTPNRNKVILSKYIILLCTFLAVTVILCVITFAAGMVCSVLYSQPIDLTINIIEVVKIMMPLLINMMLGFSMALVTQDTTVAVALYFVIPPVTVVMEQIPFLSDYAKWFSLGHSSSIFVAGVTSHTTAQYMCSLLIWIAVPSLIGIILNKKRDVN